MSPWWAVPSWAVLGGLIGTTLHRPCRGLLTVARQDHPLIAAGTLASATAVLFGILAWRVGAHPELLAYSALAAVCVPVAAIDLLEQRMPARLLLPAYPLLAVLFGLTAAVEHNAASILRALAGMAILLAFYLTIALLFRDGLGAADIRLAGLLGLALGWQGWATLIGGTLLGLLYGSLTGIIMIILRWASRNTLIPFGPALIAGAFTALLLSTG